MNILYEAKMMKKLNLNNLFFLIGILLIEISYTASNVILFQNYLKIIKFAGLFILLINFLLTINKQSYPIQKLMIVFVLLSISFIIYVEYSAPLMIELILIALNCMKREFDDIVKSDFKVKVFILLIILLNYFLGKTNGDYERIMREDVIRYSLGFFHPNTLSMFIMLILFEYIYLKRKYLNIKNILFVLIISLISMKVTDSRTAFYCVLILIFSMLRQNKHFCKNNIISFVLKHFFMILLIGSLFISILYINNTNFVIELNDIVNNRISIQSEFLKNYNITLLGNSINYNKTLDNGFLKLLLNFGLITTICYSYISYKNFVRGLKENKVYVVVWLILLLYSLSESYMIYSAYNIFIIYHFCNNKNDKETQKSIYQ